jgi:predicted enzyme related to lactoylglutathione lyase
MSQTGTAEDGRRPRISRSPQLKEFGDVIAFLLIAWPTDRTTTQEAHIMSSTVSGITFDAHDAQKVAGFWAAVLGRTVADGASPDHAIVTADPAVPGSRIGFFRVPESKTVKNRMHFDLITTDFDAEIDRLTGLGATKLNEVKTNFAHWFTLADPEGNEFDVIEG